MAIIENSAPYFVTELLSFIEIDGGTDFRLRLPQIRDPEGELV